MPRYMKKPYKHGGHTIPGMFKNSGLPKAQNGWLDAARDKIKNISRKVVDAAPIRDVNKKKVKSTAKNYANRINSFFGGSSNYWKRGGSTGPNKML